ncbi:hypothetical protein NADFUDRAFT_82440 [Nadsonia fulvescens var. elongata DSM 6958]|uniref:Probable methionine--tRNA ligase, mitochondrial n=1 Tax=Nadsonia fulvescens var. elongata DSM 6958 TaxID=857566 RepID=A0A1E3PPB8_9ASCO|nr:hypothetical protein NADFUDRAFT_82440 [Nadsonia fulvescens var. elongata DSM 6958]
MVLSDIIKRWRMFNDGKPGMLTTGTDEHGLKIEIAAENAGIDTKIFVDGLSDKFKILMQQANISAERFIRTTDSDHVTSCISMWELLKARGFIYKGKHSGWYCISDETFYPETQIEDIVDTSTGKRCMVSKETGKSVEWTSEDNYYFAMSKVKEQLLAHLRKNPKCIIPKSRYDEIIKTVMNSEDNDLSISRPKSRVKWGIPVPGDDTQTIYVWLDALVNYLTSTGFPWKTEADFMKSAWPADVHLVGKDIIKFHCIYWPSFLLAAGLPLPKQVVVHSHWTMNGTKMSKSLGNVVDPTETIAHFGNDSVRFFLANDGHLGFDSNYSDERVQERHNVELANKYSNLLVRVCGPAFNIERALARTPEDLQKAVELAFQDKSHLLETYSNLKTNTNSLVCRMNDHMNEFCTAHTLDRVRELIADTNKFVQDAEPWKFKKEDNLAIQDAIIYIASEVSRISSLALQPFMPDISSKALNRLNVSIENRTVDYALIGADRTYGKGANRKGDHPVTHI